MAEESHLDHINRPLTDEEQQQSAAVRAGAEKDFPPKARQDKPSPAGIPSQIRSAREQRGITRYELGQIANVASTAVRAIEQGDDVPLSQFRAVAEALGLAIELVGR